MTVTREAAAAKAREVLGADVTAYDHAELERDLVAGGFAFVAGDRGAIIGHDGGYQTSMLELSGETMDTLIAGWLIEQRHRLPAAPTRSPHHPCPICGAPTGHLDRYPLSVCADCQARAADSAGRTVVGFNEGMSGGLTVFHVVDGRPADISDEVMTSGLCWIDDIPCSMEEARFGGVVVQTLGR